MGSFPRPDALGGGLGEAKAREGGAPACSSRGDSFRLLGSRRPHSPLCCPRRARLLVCPALVCWVLVPQAALKQVELDPEQVASPCSQGPSGRSHGGSPPRPPPSSRVGCGGPPGPRPHVSPPPPSWTGRSHK